MRQTTDVRYLIVPGWQGSSAEHWQSHWQQVLPACARVEQDDWLLPERQAWVAQAPAALLDRVCGALLVAPADVERSDCPEPLRNFAPMPNSNLPFASVLIGSSNDHAATAQRALEFAQAWGSEAVIVPNAGHINVQSGHHRWEQGFAWLYQLQEHAKSDCQRSA